jgi:hypothetical protein
VDFRPGAACHREQQPGPVEYGAVVVSVSDPAGEAAVFDAEVRHPDAAGGVSDQAAAESSSPVEGPSPAPTEEVAAESEWWAESTPTVRDELRSNQGGRTRAKAGLAAELEASRGGSNAADPAPAKAEEPFQSVQLVEDESDLEAFLDSRPDLAGTLPVPKTDGEALRNAELIRHLQAGDAAQQYVQGVAAAQAAEAAVGQAYEAMAVGDDPSQAVVALLATAGPDSPELAEVLESWAEDDPDGLDAFSDAAAAAVAHYQSEQAVQAQLADNEKQIADLLQQRHQAGLAAIERFAEGRPDADEYVPAMFELAVAAGVDLTDPATVEHKLAALYESARQLDPQAQPRKDLVTGRVNKSAAWEAEQQEAVLNASGGVLLRNPGEISRFNQAQEHRGIWADSSGRIHVTPKPDLEVVETFATPRIDRAQWEATEADRMGEAWERPSVRDQLHGRRDARGRYKAAQEAAEAARPGKEEGDPYWSYVAGFS